MKFVTRGCIEIELTHVKWFVLLTKTLPCQNVTTTFFHVKFYTLLENSPVFTSVVIIIANYFCRMIFKRIVPNESTYFQVTGTPLRPGNHCYGSRRRITNVNFGFKQFVTAVGIYAFMTMDNISIMCRNSLFCCFLT